MAQTTTWKISDMQRNASDGGVHTVYWECHVSETVTIDGEDETFTATEGGKLRLTPDTDDDDFVAYDNLTEATVLGWVYDSLREGDETATEAKTRIETDRQGKVTAQKNKRTSDASGMPW